MCALLGAVFGDFSIAVDPPTRNGQTLIIAMGRTTRHLLGMSRERGKR